MFVTHDVRRGGGVTVAQTRVLLAERDVTKD